MISADVPWSLTLCDDPLRELTLDQVRTLDADAVCPQDGYEYRYHCGGEVTFFSLRTREELQVSVPQGLPVRSWWHLPSCSCPTCGEMQGKEVVRTAGLEPAAFGSVDRRSDPTELRAHADREYTRNAGEG